MLKIALERLKGELDARRQKDLFTLVSQQIERLQLALAQGSHRSATATATAPRPRSNSVDAGAVPAVEAVDADDYWLPFKMACQPTLPPKVREVALDCVQKLLAHHVLRGAKWAPAADGSAEDASTATSAATASMQEDGKQQQQQPLGSYPPMLIDDVIHTGTLNK
jgi:hypothetical protein